VIAGLAAGIDRALLFILEELDQFRDDSFINPEAFLAGMLCKLQTANGGLRILF